ncbi:MAG TPA: hypothetical protein VNX88_09810 [Terriglobales bacterium]|nr:hypothetical protein [Terriglobales bacterium]
MPDIPLAYLITFRCYGTWLHGDERGSIDRHQNQYQSPYIVPNPNWHTYNLRRLNGQGGEIPEFDSPPIRYRGRY